MPRKRKQRPKLQLEGRDWIDRWQGESEVLVFLAICWGGGWHFTVNFSGDQPSTTPRSWSTRAACSWHPWSV
uniref:Uncharacterized protein n=1 Tax=Salix viminalis TaxID=40686 RepID=A0A6N2LUQ7_SALVM